MELRKGITGFRHVNDPPLPSTDLLSFRSYCFAAARMLGGKVAHPGLEPVRVEANFTWLVLELPTGAVAVLLNRHSPVVGFARPWGEDGPHGLITFLNCERLAGVFEEMGGYEVVSQTELGRPVRPDDLRQLSPAEMEQVKYWKPRRLGDIVFNFWD
jgi:hypothetical protein